MLSDTIGTLGISGKVITHALDIDFLVPYGFTSSSWNKLSPLSPIT